MVADASELEGGVSSIDKTQLMEETSRLLKSLKGTMFTGCDMNTTLDDMSYLSEQCDYVLAAIGNPDIDPNVCTAYGVVGALEAALGGEANCEGKVLVVHGCGNVGATAAEEMAKRGATVYTVDVVTERADVPGCVNISGVDTPWWAFPCDIVVPCSKSGLFTAEICRTIDAKAIIGATNLPFASDEAYAAAEERGICYIPEGVSSAGAVIADSVEHFDKEGFAASQPTTMYEFVRSTVERKTATLLAHSLHAKPSPISPVRAISLSADATHAGRDGALQQVGMKHVGELFAEEGWLVRQRQQASGGLKQQQQRLGGARTFSSSSKSSNRSFSTAAIDVDLDVEEADLKHTPFGEDGAGYYSEATKGCYDVIANAKELVADAVTRVLSQRAASGAAAANEPFTIADFGTADAGTSMPLMRAVVSQVRAAEGDGTPIVVAYEDQTNNDWNSVFRRVHGVLPGADASYLQGPDAANVFAVAVGTSFYQPCFPAGTVDVSFSATAMHWLSSVPCALPDALHSACSTDPAASAAFEAQAAKDWLHIVSRRSWRSRMRTVLNE